MAKIMDKAEVYRALEIFAPNKSLIEVRAIHSTKKNDIWSGYFKDYDLLWDSIQRFDSDYNIYFIFNIIDDSCYSMVQKDKMLYGAENTKDTDIIARSWVLIDLDANRNHKKISSTDEEWQDARLKAHAIRNYLRDMGFSYPIVCTSGNGIHLMYKIDEWAINDENNKLVTDFLNALALLFSDDKVDVDVKVGNSSRITKLYGTVARKGANDAKRPHRVSKILVVPDDIKCTDKEYFRKIASILPVEERTNYYSIKNSEGFNIDSFIKEHKIGVSKDTTFNGNRKIVLEECPFDHSHKAPDSAIFVLPSGAIGFTCFHSSCSQYTFKDFRLHYDPNAYSKKYDSPSYKDFRKPIKKEFEPILETKEKGEKWIKLSTVEKYKVDPANFIQSGIKQLDNLIIGFKRGHVSVWSGYRGCGKSTILNQLILNAANKGYKSALWTGELDNSEVKTWLFLQAAGKQWNKPSQFNKFYYTPDNVSNRIDPWIDKYFWLFNNEYGDNFKQIEYEIRELKEKEDLDVVILDNLMCLDIDDIDGDKYDRQKQLMKLLTKLAKDLNIHIHLVAHPNKSGSFLRPNNISGSGHIPDLAQNVFISHKIGKDFQNDSKEFLSPIERSTILESGCSLVIEICKCREKGSATDHFVKLWFEDESNRVKDNIAEHICYGWEDPPKPQSLSLPDPSPHWKDKESKDLSSVQAMYDSADGVLPFGDSKEECPF